MEGRFDPAALRAHLTEQNITVTDIRPLTPSLEDVFVVLTYRHQAALEFGPDLARYHD
ncbi:MAG TPA: hypothetical protein VN648_07710 [Candidatus Methylomirabilis sp.]|nr:hypothetical protein [Candidatus Methylomirabilis sp.]